MIKGKCPHGEFELIDGCQKCIDKRWRCIYLTGMGDEYVDYCKLQERICEGECETCKDKIRSK